MKCVRVFVLLLMSVCFSLFSLALMSVPDALWGRSVVAAEEESSFAGVALGGGNVYVAGFITGNGIYDFGNGVKVNGSYDASGPYDGWNAVLVKYNGFGIAQWAKSTVASSDKSTFSRIALDGSENIYVVGAIYDTDTYDFGNGVAVNGAYGGGTSNNNPVLVKYNSNGVPQWARSVISGPGYSNFGDVAVGGSGNIYVVGAVSGTGIYDFGNGVMVSGTSMQNALLLKYDNDGVAQWLKSTISAPPPISWSIFGSTALDNNGDIYAVGFIFGNGTFGFGNGVEVGGGVIDTNNAFLVKYNENGDAQWAKSVVNGTDESNFATVVSDNNGDIYVSGIIWGNNVFDFGDGVKVAGADSSWNMVLVKYDSGGNTQWARSMVSGSSSSNLVDLALDSIGNVYATGIIKGSDTFDLGGGVTVNGVCDFITNAFLLKYDSNGNIQWAKTVESGIDVSYFTSLALDASGSTHVSGFVKGNNTFDFGNGVTVRGAYHSGSLMGGNAVLVKYDVDDNPPNPSPTGSVVNSAASEIASNNWLLAILAGVAIIRALN